MQIQFCDNDEAVEMIRKFEKVLHGSLFASWDCLLFSYFTTVHFGKVRGSRMSANTSDPLSRRSSVDTGSTVSSWLTSLDCLENDDVGTSKVRNMRGSSSQKLRQQTDTLSSQSNRYIEHSRCGSSVRAASPRFDMQRPERGMQALTLNTSVLSSRDRQLVESPTSIKFSPTPESQRPSCSHPGHSSRTLSRELRLRDRTVYVRDLSKSLESIQSTPVKDGTGGFGAVRKGVFVDEEQTPRRRVTVAIKSIKAYRPTGVINTKVRCSIS